MSQQTLLPVVHIDSSGVEFVGLAGTSYDMWVAADDDMTCCVTSGLLGCLCVFSGGILEC